MLPNGRGGLYRGCITIASGRIVEVAPIGTKSVPAGGDLDFGLHVALPGFIDLQVNGAFGHDITTAPWQMWAIGERLLEHGVTAFLPTVITCPAQSRQAAYDAIRVPPAGYAGAAALGLHIEGPALSADRAGAHPLAHIVTRTGALADELVANADAVALVTLAPEAAGAGSAIARLARAGIAISVGHTAATAAQTREALATGASAFTHLFNAMGPLHHREVGPAGAGLLDPEAWVSIIVDGHHVADDAVRLAWQLAGPRRICLATDAMAGMDAPAGMYRLGSVEVQCGQTARTDRGGLAGSLLTMGEAARRLRALTEGTWDDLAAVTSANQADLLGDADRGQLVPGRRADIAVIDRQLRPVATIVAGTLAWGGRDRVRSVGTVTKDRPGASTAGAVSTSRVDTVHRQDPATSTACGAPAAIGVDIGGTTFKAAVFDGAHLGPVQRGETGRHRSAAEVLAEIRDIIIDLAAGTSDLDLRGVGIACAGILDTSAGTVIRAANLGWSDVNVVASLRGDHGLPIALEHDVYAAALAEWETGAGIGAESMFYVSVGTGVAGRLFTRSGTERGHANLAGEMGFMPLGDGNRWLESVASGRAMSDAYRARSGRRLTAQQIAAAAEDGDPVAAEVWFEAMDALARGNRGGRMPAGSRDRGRGRRRVQRRRSAARRARPADRHPSRAAARRSPDRPGRPRHRQRHRRSGPSRRPRA